MNTQQPQRGTCVDLLALHITPEHRGGGFSHFQEFRERNMEKALWCTNRFPQRGKLAISWTAHTWNGPSDRKRDSDCMEGLRRSSSSRTFRDALKCPLINRNTLTTLALLAFCGMIGALARCSWLATLARAGTVGARAIWGAA